MQDVQTFMRTAPPCGRWTRMDCRFGSNRRRVRLFACETLFPNCGPNLQSIRVQRPQGGNVRMKVCTSCIKAGKVAKAV